MKRHTGGFTIIEVLMFLAISGAMFTIAFFGTRKTQDSVALRDAINLTEFKIREVINNVDNGYTGNIDNYVCSASGASISVTPGATANSGGSNQTCVYKGKEITTTNGSNLIGVNTIIAPTNPALNFDIRTVSGLNETYLLKHDVRVQSPGNIKFEVIRDRNGAGNGDYRAFRMYYPSGGGTATNINENPATHVKICLRLGSSVGAVIVTDKEVTSQYRYSGVCS